MDLLVRLDGYRVEKDRLASPLRDRRNRLGYGVNLLEDSARSDQRARTGVPVGVGDGFDASDRGERQENAPQRFNSGIRSVQDFQLNARHRHSWRLLLWHGAGLS